MNPNAPYNSRGLADAVARIKVFCAHVIPLVFDNTLSYYETICACVAKVNELVDAVNSQNLTITEFCHMVELEINNFEEYIQGQYNALDTRVTTLETDVDSLKQRMTEAENNITTLTADMETAKANITALFDNVTMLDNVVQQHGVDLANTMQRVTTLENTYASESTAGKMQVGNGLINTNNQGGVRVNIDTNKMEFLPPTQQGSFSDRISVKTTNNVESGNNLPVTSDAVYQAMQGASSNVPYASEVNAGKMRVGAGLTTADNQGLVNVNIGDNIVFVADGQGYKIAVPVATQNTLGVVKGGTNITIDANGSINVASADNVNKGVVRLGRGLEINSNDDTAEINIGDNLRYETDGLNYCVNVPIATSSTSGVVKVGSNIEISNGFLNVPTATTTTKGVLRLGDSLELDQVNDKVNVKLGAVAQGNTLPVSGDDVYTAIQASGGGQVIGDATTISKGIVQIGDNINVTNGVITVPLATTSSYGVVKYGNNFNINSNGQLSVALGANITTDTYGALTVPNATSVVKGVVNTTSAIATGNNDVPTSDAVYTAIQNIPYASNVDAGKMRVGAGLKTGDNQGLVNVNIGSNLEYVADGSDYKINVPIATQSALGVVKGGTNTTIDGNGSVNVASGDTVNKGVVRLGRGLTLNSNSDTAELRLGSNLQFVANGLEYDVNVPNGSTSTRGAVMYDGTSIQEGLTGKLFVPTATDSVKGIVKLGNTLELDQVSEAVNVKFGTVTSGDTLPVSGGDVHTAMNNLINRSGCSVYSNNGYADVRIGNNLTKSNTGAINVPLASTSSNGVVQLTSRIASGNTDVPTSDAVYNAIQRVGSVTKYSLTEIINSNVTYSTDNTEFSIESVYLANSNNVQLRLKTKNTLTANTVYTLPVTIYPRGESVTPEENALISKLQLCNLNPTINTIHASTAHNKYMVSGWINGSINNHAYIVYIFHIFINESIPTNTEISIYFNSLSFE